MAKNCNYKNPRSFYELQTSCDKSISDEITMQPGEYYYMEIFVVNIGGAGHFTIAAEMPNPNPNPNADPTSPVQVNTVTDVQLININYETLPEKISIKVFGFTQ